MSADIHNILDRLQTARRRDNGIGALRGLLLTCAGFVGASLLLLGIEALFWTGTALRTGFVLTLLCGVGISLIWLAGVPFARRIGILPSESDVETARRVGVIYPQIHDRLMNAVQLARQRAEVASYYSTGLLDAALDDATAEVGAADFSAIVDYRPMRMARTWFLALVAVSILVAALLPHELGQAAFRIVHCREVFVPPAPYFLHVFPGNRDVVKGESVEVSVRVEGKTDAVPTIELQPEGQVTAETHTLPPGADGTYRYHIDDIRVSTAYTVRCGTAMSVEYLLRVLDRPSITSLALRLNYPRHTGLPVKDLEENIGDVTAPAGTSVHFRIRSTKPVVSGAIRFADSTSMALSCVENTAGGSIILHNDRSYHLDIVDAEGLHNADPIEYSLHAIADAYPTVTIVAPGTNLSVAGTEQLPMLFRITDDYGVSRFRLAHRLIHSRYEPAARDFTYVELQVLPPAGSSWIVPYEWALAELHLSPEDVVEYHAEVFDNDGVTGPKSATSESFTLRLPSIDEVFADADKAHDLSQQQLDQALKQAEDARKDLDELSREMKKQQQKLNWDEQKKAEELAKRYNDIQKKIDDVQRTVNKMVDEMQKNNALSPETLQKYAELQQLMEQISSPEFAEAMKRLQQSMQQMNPQALQQALQQFQFSEEQFRKSIERTLNLLKRIQIEQKMDEMLKRAESMEKTQEELQKELEKHSPSNKESAEQAAREQEELRKEAAELDRGLDSLARRMEEFPSEMPVKEMKDLQSSMDKSDLETSMQQSAEQIREGNFEQAGAQQQKSAQTLSAMKQSLEQMKQKMLQNQQRQIVQEMQRATRDLLELSKRQEQLKNDSRNLDPSSQRFRENAERQMESIRDLGNITSRLSGLSQKTFSISPEMGKSIGDAMRSMGEAMESLEQRNGTQAAQHQSGAMGSLNQTAQQLQEAIQGLMQSGGQGGMGMAGFMQRMQKLAGMQQGINNATQGLTPQQAAEMARLAGEQGMVRKSLEDLAREANTSGTMSKLLGDLNRIATDMREVQTDLAQGNVNAETLHKQERILSRMLDAQRSMRERDYEKRRKAESGVDVARRGPATLDLSTQEGRDRLQRDLLRALEEGYNKDYEELIRKYFEKLQK
jgi:hypothetical protein